MSQGLGASFDRAQARYDAQEPPDDHDCEEDGHRWRITRVSANQDDTVIEYRCTECGQRKVE